MFAKVPQTNGLKVSPVEVCSSLLQRPAYGMEERLVVDSDRIRRPRGQTRLFASNNRADKEGDENQPTLQDLIENDPKEKRKYC